MIEGNRIIFGYGTIAVGHNPFCGAVTFKYIEPPQEIGKQVDESIIIKSSDEICVYVNINEAIDLIDLLNTVNEDNCVIQYKDYILDFTKFNKKSVDVIIKHVDMLISFLILPYAC